MRKEYQIKHNFFFDDCDYKKEYKFNYLIPINQIYSYIIKFSDILKVENEKDFIKVVKTNLLPLYPPLLYLDDWPNNGDKQSIKYYYFLLENIVKKIVKYDIIPIVSFTYKDM